MFSFPINVLLSFPLPSDHPEKRGPEIWIITAIFLTATTICIGVRLWSRLIIRRWLGIDDVFIVLAFLCSVAVTALSTVGTMYYDWDMHVYDVNLVHVAGSLKILYLARIFWGLSSSFVRLSVITLYYRLLESCDAPKSYRYVLHATTFFNFALLIYYFISGVFPCLPVKAYWEWPPISDAKCIDDGLSMQVSAVVNTLAEIFLATLPTIAIFKLKVDARQRWQVLSILSLGYFVGLAGCFRTYYIFKCFTTWDLTWYSNPQWICSEVEIDLGIICACAAPIKPFFNRVTRQLSTQPILAATEDHDMTTHNQSVMSNTIDTKSPPLPLFTVDSHSFDRAASEWSQAMQRIVDIEGIITDGYGYTVSITGPASSSGSRRRRAKGMLAGLVGKRRDEESLEDIKEYPNEEGYKTTQVVVTTEERGDNFGPSLWTGNATEEEKNAEMDQLNFLSPCPISEEEEIDLGSASRLRDYSDEIDFADWKGPEGQSISLHSQSPNRNESNASGDDSQKRLL